MLIFHEGLPGSGKSYEAVLTRIIPALKERRQVFAYIEGLNFEKFAEITEIPLERLKGVVNELDNGDNDYQGLLFQIDKEQVPDIQNQVANDSLVIIDELQDFFPVGRSRLSDGITEFVTQHRHRGIDIIAMGQDHRDCHNLWKRRIDQLIHFVKRDAIGQSTKYTWKSFKQNQGKFIKLRSGKGSYNPAYFGLYASHTNETENTGTYADDRTNIFKSNVFLVYIPAAVVLAIVAVIYLKQFFSPKAVHKPTVTKLKQPVHEKTTVQPVKPHLPTEPPKPVYVDFIDELYANYRFRLGGVIRSPHGNDFIVYVYDETLRHIETFYKNDFVFNGWTLNDRGDFLLAKKADKTLIIRQWRADRFAAIPSETRNHVDMKAH